MVKTMEVAKDKMKTAKNKKLFFTKQNQQNDEYLPLMGYRHMLIGRGKQVNSNSIGYVKKFKMYFSFKQSKTLF